MLINNGVIGVALVLFSTIFSSVGAILLKEGMNRIAKLSLVSVILSKWVIGGVILYIFGAIGSIILLSFLDYSIAFPLGALTYVWTTIISYFSFNEKITVHKILAITLIVLGVYIISR